jgi:predicted amidophosphoribosyltransferase
VNVRGLTLVVVDDVSTTGATLAACARPLLDGGAREVRALTAAKTLAVKR